MTILFCVILNSFSETELKACRTSIAHLTTSDCDGDEALCLTVCCYQTQKLRRALLHVWVKHSKALRDSARNRVATSERLSCLLASRDSHFAAASFGQVVRDEASGSVETVIPNQSRPALRKRSEVEPIRPSILRRRQRRLDHRSGWSFLVGRSSDRKVPIRRDYRSGSTCAAAF